MGRESGYSVIEILFSFTIPAIAGIGLFYLASTSTAATTRNRDQAAAAALAIAKLEELKSTPFEDLAAGSDGPIEGDGTSGGIFSRQWTVATSSPSGVPARDLTVTVTWDETKTLSLRTLVVEPAEGPVNGAISYVQSWNQEQ